MREGWQSKPLNELIDVQSGFAFRSEEYSSSGHFLIRIGNVQDGYVSLANPKYVVLDSKTSRFELREGDLLTSLTGNIGRVAVVKDCHLPAALNQRVAKLALKELGALDKSYLSYFLSSSRFRESLSSVGHGAAQQNVSPAAIGDIRIAFPALTEQKRIVAILDGAFAGIDTAVANTEKNLANARELFDSHLISLFARKGEGWIERKLGDVCSLRSGTTVSSDLERPTGDIPYLKVADMTHPKNLNVISTSSRFLNQADISKNGILPVGTTIFPKRGGAIMTNKKRLTEVEVCTDLNIMGVIPSEAILPNFLFMYFLTVDMRKLGSGSSIPQINNYDIEPLVIAFPESKARQAGIVRTLQGISLETRHLEDIYKKKLAYLAELKRSALDRAFAGELTSHSEKALPEAAE